MASDRRRGKGWTGRCVLNVNASLAFLARQMRNACRLIRRDLLIDQIDREPIEKHFSISSSTPSTRRSTHRSLYLLYLHIPGESVAHNTHRQMQHMYSQSFVNTKRLIELTKQGANDSGPCQIRNDPTHTLPYIYIPYRECECVWTIYYTQLRTQIYIHHMCVWFVHVALLFLSSKSVFIFNKKSKTRT